jgi:hypothetical protein
VSLDDYGGKIKKFKKYYNHSLPSIGETSSYEPGMLV